MYSYETLPSEWFASRKRPRSYHYLPPMSRPVSKSFNRISDFIFPDTVHIRLHQQQPVYRRYQRNENYSLPVLNRHNINQHDLIVVERLPVDELANVDFLYREQYQNQQQQYEPTRQVRRRYSSIVDERRAPFNEKMTTGLVARPTAYRERIRDRRKRHTTDNAYHSLMKSMLEEEESQYVNAHGGPNYILSYRTTLDPITDSESMASVNQQQQQQQPQKQHTNNISVDEWKQQTHCRVPINGTIPIMTERERPRQRQHSSSSSSRDSSSDTDITARHPTTINYTHCQQQSSFTTASNDPPAISMPRPAVWERLQSDPMRFRHEPDIFIPINPAAVTDTNNQETTFHSNNVITSSPFDNIADYQTSNQTSSQPVQESAHHVSLCVNDLHTTLFIDENALNNTKTSMNSNNNNNNGKAVIKTFIDRIIKRLQHFKRSLDNGLIHVRKKNTLVNGPIISADYRSKSETTRRKNELIQSNDYHHQQNTSWSVTFDGDEENKLVRPYFLIRPQPVLVLPNEIAKFKCCFGGDPLPTIVWSHNDSRIPEIIAAGGSTSSQYRTYKLHDINYLDIGPVNIRDNGQIKCTLMNRYGREEAIAQLTVVSSASDATPRITQPLNDITIIEGRPLKLSCGIVGLQVAVNWFHNNNLISSTTQVKTDYNGENAIFSLSRCMRTDAGTIDCIVKNRFGEARTSCRVEVVNDPEFDR
ncbi:unnamed protein product [Rotaria sp. Silwood1]|nr:unnamed protein product [Rotaria sp. Silwood1]CAF0859358.1 unnamed protein product [Rotaria sp. Silwood1]CAF3378912.1 unnamed protein product [Rotaria sp. Silwood1]CAF3378920.1 unnamed protein product [Rotaria sp. Silwood1]CAF3386935.1 unnamed protein product [Rotaria sp. Silwood1]